VGLIVNDMSEVNVDAALISGGDGPGGGAVSVTRVEDKLVELSNGCICCTLREDLLRVMIGLARERRFDYLVIESSGISEPLPVAEVFALEDLETGDRLADHAQLDTLVTVVDGLNFLRDYTSAESLVDRRLAAFEGAWRGRASERAWSRWQGYRGSCSRRVRGGCSCN
jgi:G3E family GTPase